MKALLLILCLTGGLYGASAQRTAPERPGAPHLYFSDLKGHALGAVISSASGKGLAYRYWPHKLGIHVAFFPAQSTEESYLSFGTAVYYTLFQEDNTRLFLLAGSEVISERLQSESTATQVPPEEELRRSRFNASIGPGVDIMTGRFQVDFHIGYGLYYSTGDQATNGTLLNLAGGFGLFYAL